MPPPSRSLSGNSRQEDGKSPVLIQRVRLELPFLTDGHGKNVCEFGIPALFLAIDTRDDRVAISRIKVVLYASSSQLFRYWLLTVTVPISKGYSNMRSAA